MNFKIHIILLFLLFCIVVWGQHSEPIQPMSFRDPITDTVIVKNIKLRTESQKSLIETDAIFPSPYRYGVCTDLNIDFKQRASKVKVDTFGTLWQLKISSPGAYAIEMLFDTFYIPKGAMLFIINKDRSAYLGAFTWQNNNKFNNLPVSLLVGDELTIEYFEPQKSDFYGKLFLAKACYAYKDISNITHQKSTLSTTPGINCKEGDFWQVEKHAVCRISYISGKYTYFCTGTLVNNTRNDETPYFLTANHCVSTDSIAKITVFYFNYEQAICDAGYAPENKTLTGSELLATGIDSDFTLLKLIKKPDSSYQAYYAGWNINDIAPKSGVCIHHPEGNPKRISLSTKAASNYPYHLKWDSNHVTPSDSHWYMVFSKGDTYSGSSGAAFFDQNKQIVGQLHGEVQSAVNNGLFGKLSTSWTLGSTKDKQLKYWLNPNNLNVTQLDGISAYIVPEPNFYTSAFLVCVNASVKIRDTSDFEPTAWKWAIFPGTYGFNNGTNDTSRHIDVSFFEQGSYSITLTARNKFGSKTKTRYDYITAGYTISPEFIGIDSSFICSNKIDSFSIYTIGAEKVTYSITQAKDRISYSFVNNELKMVFNKAMLDTSWFYVNIKALASQASCSTTIEKTLKIYVPLNDNIEDALQLKLGDNGYFSNECATVQINEPKPRRADCNVGWCPEDGEVRLDNSLWYKFVAPQSDYLSIGTWGLDNQLALYDVNSELDLLNGNYRLVQANDNKYSSAELKDLELVPGKIYYLQIDGSGGGKTGEFIVWLRASGFEVFSNPTKGIVEIMISASIKNDFTVEVFSAQGGKIYGRKFNYTEAAVPIPINLTGQYPGVYNIVVNLEGVFYSKRVIKY